MTRLPPDETSLGLLLQQLAGNYRHNAALIDQRGETLDFIHLFRYTKFINTLLSEHGIRQHDRVALVMEQGMLMSATSLAVMTGCVCVPINPAQTVSEIKRLLERHRIASVIVSKQFVSLARSIDDAQQLDIIQVDKEALFLSSDDVTGKEYKPGKPDIALILHTSGSTSTAKAVALSHLQLIASANNVLRSLELTDNDRCLNAMPPFHIGAIVDLSLAPLMAGGQVIVTADANAESFWSICESSRPTWYQGVPTMLTSIKDTAPGNAVDICRSLRFIRAVSSKLSSVLAESVQETLETPVIEIYGMTEAAGLITSNPLSANKTGSVGVSAGPELKILDQHGNEAASGSEGEILIKGDNVITAYVEDPETNQTSFIGGWLRTGDRGYLDAEGYLFITGRIKEIINRGGEKISPLEIDLLLAELPDVVEAAAFPLPHPTLGEEVAVAIVKNADSNITGQSIRSHLQEKLAAYKLPQQVFFVDALPRAAGGKLKRHEIAAIVQADDKNRQDREADLPDDRLAQKIAREWKAILNLEQIRRDDNFFELGGDSLKAATLMNRLEKKNKLSLPTALLFDKPDFYQLYEYIRKTLAENVAAETSTAVADVLPSGLEHRFRKTMQAWPGKRLKTGSLINGFNTLGELPPLFWCCQFYEEVMPLIEGLGSDQPVYVMHSLNNMVKREKRDYPQLAKRYISEITAIQHSGPFYIGGFCGGARVAHEIARKLQADGYDVGLLCLQEIYINRPYSGRVAMFCSSSGVYSPIGLFNFPEMGIGQLYTGEIALHQYNCSHNEFFREGGARQDSQKFIQDLANELQCVREGRESPARRQYSKGKINTEHFLSGRIDILAPRLMPAAKTVSIRVMLQNTGNTPWQPTSDSGITISSRLLNIRNGVKNARTGYAIINGVLDSGEKHFFTLDIETTKTGGLRYLEVDLLKEGVGWIAKNNQPRFGKWIWIK